MEEVDVTPLFTPCRIGPLTVANRFIVPSMQRGVSKEGAPTVGMRDYLAARIHGGFALVLSESCAVDHPLATSQRNATRLTAETAPAWANVIAGVHEAGGKMFMQLWHEGATRRAEGDGAAPSISPSGLIRKGVENGSSASAEDLEVLRKAYVRSARLAREIGADGVEIHACHGYLMDQFLWSETNLRQDGYGGATLARRLRFPAEIVKAVRQEIGRDLALSIRLSQWKEADFDATTFADMNDVQAAVRAFEAAGVDMFHISQRRFYQETGYIARRSLAGCFKACTSLPVASAGSVGLDTELRDMIFGDGSARVTARDSIVKLVKRFEAGEFDLIAVGRASIGDGEWVNKVRAGRYDDIRTFDRSDLADAEGWDTFAFDAGAQ
jgi:2,4-dienoyl-CoA reductase-like NADH-dependent reductase (Old Yellow Enzyme family)